MNFPWACGIRFLGGPGGCAHGFAGVARPFRCLSVPWRPVGVGLPAEARPGSPLEGRLQRAGSGSGLDRCQGSERYLLAPARVDLPESSDLLGGGNSGVQITGSRWVSRALDGAQLPRREPAQGGGACKGAWGSVAKMCGGSGAPRPPHLAPALSRVISLDALALWRFLFSAASSYIALFLSKELVVEFSHPPSRNQLWYLRSSLSGRLPLFLRSSFFQKNP